MGPSKQVNFETTSSGFVQKRTDSSVLDKLGDRSVKLQKVLLEISAPEIQKVEQEARIGSTLATATC